MLAKSGHKRKRGFTLAELLVSMALLSAMTTALVVLYSAALTEFEHGAGTMNLNQRAREVVDRVTQILKTAAPVLNFDTQAFVHPDNLNDLGQLMYEADFISTICFIPVRAYGTSWTVTDNLSAAYVNDPDNPRTIYESDQSLTTFVTRQPSLYRYRIAWNHLPTPLTTQGRNIPARAIYFERLEFARNAATETSLKAGPNGTSYANGPQIADTGKPVTTGANRARIIGRDVHNFTLQRTSGNVILLRLRMYNRDPDTNVAIDGSTMRRVGMGGNKDVQRAGPNKQRLFSVDLVTNIHLPNMLR